MKQSVLLKFGEVIIKAYESGEITQEEQSEMLDYVNHFLLLDMVKDEEAEKAKAILAENHKIELNGIEKK